MESLLKQFRNADYAYLTTVEIAGVKRVVGFTPEASAYGPICVDFAAGIALLRTLYAEGLQRVLATLVAIGLVVMALLSTSSTAYLGLAGVGSGLRGELGQARGIVLGVRTNAGLCGSCLRVLACLSRWCSF